MVLWHHIFPDVSMGFPLSMFSTRGDDAGRGGPERDGHGAVGAVVGRAEGDGSWLEAGGVGAIGEPVSIWDCMVQLQGCAPPVISWFIIP